MAGEGPGQGIKDLCLCGVSQSALWSRRAFYNYDGNLAPGASVLSAHGSCVFLVFVWRSAFCIINYCYVLLSLLLFPCHIEEHAATPVHKGATITFDLMNNRM